MTDRGLQRLCEYQPAKSPGNGRLDDYRAFCEAANRLMAAHDIPPELLDAVLAEAGRVQESTAPVKPKPAGASVWLFQANPSIYDIDQALSELEDVTWVVRQYKGDVHAGDRVYLWRSGADAGVVATATVTSDPAELPGDGEDPYILKAEALAKPELRVRLHIDSVLPEALKRSRFSLAKLGARLSGRAAAPDEGAPEEQDTQP